MALAPASIPAAFDADFVEDPVPVVVRTRPPIRRYLDSALSIKRASPYGSQAAAAGRPHAFV
jgi:hypothetical protein